MKKIFHYILIAALCGTVVPLTSCDDDDEPLNEWTGKSYVSLLQADYLRPTQEFSLKHITDKKIEETVEYKVMVTLQKPASRDVAVTFDVTCDGFSADKVAMSASAAVVKAGEVKSEPVTFTIADWTELEAVEEAMECSMKIAVKDIQTEAPEVTHSDYNRALTVKIKKTQAKGDQLVFGVEPENSDLDMGVSAWDFVFMDGVENAGSNSVAGTGGSDVATNGVPFWFTVDFKEEKIVTGLITWHWGPYFAPSCVEVFTSADGKKWKSVGEVNTGGEQQVFSFKAPVKTRHLKYQMIEVPGRVDVTYFGVYMAK